MNRLATLGATLGATLCLDPGAKSHKLFSSIVLRKVVHDWTDLVCVHLIYVDIACTQYPPEPVVFTLCSRHRIPLLPFAPPQVVHVAIASSVRV
jgi:hypothetical protein